MNRRTFIASGLGLPALLLPGCAILAGIFRFGARGGLVRRGARSARMSPRGSVLTLGRAASSTLQLIRLVNITNRIQELQSVGQVVSTETGNVAVDIVAKDSLCETYVEGAAISTSERRGLYDGHYVNLYGRQYEVGQSIMLSDQEVEHRDLRNRFLGADKFEKDRIQHYDADKQLKGITPLRVDRTPGRESAEISDDSYLMDELETTTRTARRDYGDGFGDVSTIVKMRTDCLNRSPAEDCDDLVQAANAALRRLEENFQ